jgi:hypothetical protein
MARVLVAVEDQHFGPLERAIRRACRHLEPAFPDAHVQFDTVRGMGGFHRFAGTNLHIARANGWMNFGQIDAAMCVMDADRASKLLKVPSPPAVESDQWLHESEGAFLDKLKEWGAPEDFPIKPHLLRWSLESLFIAGYDTFASDEVLKILGTPLGHHEARSGLNDYFKNCTPDIPANCPDNEFCERWQKPQRCLDGMVKAVGAASLAKQAVQRVDLTNLLTPGDRLDTVLQRVPDLEAIARSLLGLLDEA